MIGAILWSTEIAATTDGCFVVAWATRKPTPRSILALPRLGYDTDSPPTKVIDSPWAAKPETARCVSMVLQYATLDFSHPTNSANPEPRVGSSSRNWQTLTPRKAGKPGVFVQGPFSGMELAPHTRIRPFSAHLPFGSPSQPSATPFTRERRVR